MDLKSENTQNYLRWAATKHNHQKEELYANQAINDAISVRLPFLDDNISPEAELQIFYRLDVIKYKIHQLLQEEKLFTTDEGLRVINYFFKIRDYLVTHNMGLVCASVEELYTPYDIEDLRAVGNMALTKAVVSFDPWQGYKFSTYAMNVIKNDVRRNNKKHTQYHSKYKDDYDMDILEDDEKTCSSDCTNTYIDRLAYALETNDANLTPAELQVITDYYQVTSASAQIIPITFKEIGKQMNVSGSRIHKIKESGLAKLKTYLLRECLTA